MRITFAYQQLQSMSGKRIPGARTPNFGGWGHSEKVNIPPSERETTMIGQEATISIM